MPKQNSVDMVVIKVIIAERMRQGLKEDCGVSEVKRNYGFTEEEQQQMADELRAAIDNATNPDEIFCYAQMLSSEGRYDLLAPILHYVKDKCNS